MPRQLKSLTHMVANREQLTHMWLIGKINRTCWIIFGRTSVVWMLEHAVLEYCVQKDVSWARTTVVRI